MIVNDAIAYALRVSGVLGVGQSALQQDTDDAMRALVMMIEQWQRRRWLVYRLDDLDTRVIPYKKTWTIGPSDADIPYPDRPGTIESAFLRQNTGWGPDTFPVDFPLRRIPSKEAWNRIPLKSLGSWPFQYYYDPTRPNGTFYLWPIPIQWLFSLHMSVPQDVSNFTGDEEITDFLPAESEEAILYNLAARLRANYQLPGDPAVLALARSSLNTLRTLNFQMQALRMPDALRRNVRFRNPMAGHFPEVAAGLPYPVLM